jgi:hypothetical protein
MQRLLLALAGVMVATAGCADPAHLRRDEQVVLLPSAGHPINGGSEWVLPINGWVYRDSWWSRNLRPVADRIGFEDIVEDPQERARVYERLAPFVVHNRDGRRLRIVLGDRTVILEPAMDDGQFRQEVRVPAHLVAEMQGHVQGAGPVIRYQVLTSPRDDRKFVGTIHLMEPQGLTIVSDIDDTIRDTQVLNTKEMLNNTFVEPLRPVPGMAELYQDWAGRWDARVHYLSASPTQLAVPIKALLHASGFPEGSMTLRKVDWRSNGLGGVLELFEAPPEFKIEDLTRLMRALPGRRYILVGDSAQSDPKVYGEIARNFREQVLLILIRDVTCCEGRDAPRYQEAFRDLPDSLWVLYRQPDEVRPLVDRRLLQTGARGQSPQPPTSGLFVRQLAAYN